MLSNKVLCWMNKTGFPLEKKSGLRFRKQSFDVYQSHYYKDFESDKSREIDVLAIHIDQTSTGIIDVAYVMNGKNLLLVETRKGIANDTEVRWLVSCKHNAHSYSSTNQKF